jgi:V/A-type H+-transporting ATPase subunit A
MLREDYLQQSAYYEVDRYCPVQKAYWMLKTIMDFYHYVQAALEAGVQLEKITGLPLLAEIGRMKELPPEQAEKAIQALLERQKYSFAELGVNGYAEDHT